MKILLSQIIQKNKRSFSLGALVVVSFLLLAGQQSMALWFGEDVPPDRPVVVELFTALGCPACPPAEIYLGQLAEHKDVIALALHVDYWDKNRKDPYGSKYHTARQLQYQKTIGSRVYTPQMIIDGEYQTVGSRTSSVEKFIRKAKRSAHDSIPIIITRDKIGIQIVAGKDGMKESNPLDVWLFALAPNKEIQASGRRYGGRGYIGVNIVQELSFIGQWQQGAQRFSLPIKAKNPNQLQFAVVIQDRKSGKIHGASILRAKGKIAQKSVTAEAK